MPLRMIRRVLVLVSVVIGLSIVLGRCLHQHRLICLCLTLCHHLMTLCLLLLLLVDSFAMIPCKITKPGSVIPFRFASFLKRFFGLTLVSLYGPMHVPDGLKLAFCDFPTEYGLIYLVALLFRYLNLGFVLAAHFQTRPQTHLMMHAILASTLQNS